jgi:hypothetical protein
MNGGILQTGIATDLRGLSVSGTNAAGSSLMTAGTATNAKMLYVGGWTISGGVVIYTNPPVQLYLDSSIDPATGAIGIEQVDPIVTNRFAGFTVIGADQAPNHTLDVQGDADFLSKVLIAVTPTLTPTATAATLTPTSTPTPTVTVTPTRTPTITPTTGVTPTLTITPTPIPTVSPIPTDKPTPQLQVGSQAVTGTCTNMCVISTVNNTTEYCAPAMSSSAACDLTPSQRLQSALAPYARTVSDIQCVISVDVPNNKFFRARFAKNNINACTYSADAGSSTCTFQEDTTSPVCQINGTTAPGEDRCMVGAPGVTVYAAGPMFVNFFEAYQLVMSSASTLSANCCWLECVAGGPPSHP